MRPKSGGEPAAVGKAEVDQSYASIMQDERVARMDVAVQHPSRVNRGVCVEQAAGQLERAAGLAAREKRMRRRRDVAPFQPLDREVRTDVDLAGPGTGRPSRCSRGRGMGTDSPKTRRRVTTAFSGS
jgi:hypothetical protein